MTESTEQPKSQFTKQLGIWIAGILATVIGGVVTAWLIPHDSTPPTIEGMVYSGTSAVPKAMVELTISQSGKSQTEHDITNENGSYRFDLTGVDKSAHATILVPAVNGQYTECIQTIAQVLQGDIHQDCQVKMVIAAAPPAALPPAAAPSPSAAPPHLPHFIAKPANLAAKFHFKS